jgi:hypothetical protein
MKKLLKMPKVQLVLFILLMVSISVLVYSLVYSHKLPPFIEQVNNATICVILTAIVTTTLLGQQSQSEEAKEKNSKVYEKKIDVYHQFIIELESIIQNGKITLGEQKNEKDELSSLLFKLAQVRMHTDEKKVLEILGQVSNINQKVAESVKQGNNKIDHKRLAECLFSIVNTLRWELYGEKIEEKERKRATSETVIGKVKNINEHIEDIIKYATDTTGFDESNKAEIKPEVVVEPLTEKNKNEIIKAFEDKIVEELKKEFSDDLWIILPEGSDRIKVTIKNKSWVGNTKVGVYDYNDADRLSFATWYNGIGYYKDVYLMIRRDLSGRYNRFNWWLNFKEPYNKWDENSAGIAAVQNRDEEFIKYIIEQLKKIANRFNEVYVVYENVYQLKSKIVKPEKLDQWIYESSCLVHDYKMDGKVLASDTYFSLNDGWEIQFFGRDDESMKFLYNLILKKYPTFIKEFATFEPNQRLVYHKFGKDEDIDKVKQSLQNLLKGFEEIISAPIENTNQPNIV